MVEEDPDTYYFVRAAALFLTTYTVLCFIFLPKIWRVFSGNDVLPLSVVAGRGSSAPPTLSNNNSGASNSANGQQHTTANSSLPGVDSTYKKYTAPPSPPFSSRAPGGSFGKDGGASNKGGARKAPFVQKMASLDSDCTDDSQDVLDPNSPVSPKEPYNQLKAGLDAEESSSSSELNELLDSDAQVTGNNELTSSLAAEISRAEQTRENVFASSVGESAPREHGLKSTSPRSAPESPSNQLPNTDPNAGNTKKWSMKRRGSPDIDSSPDSSSNTNGYDPLTHANAALQEALMPFQRQNSPDDSDGSDDSNTSSGESVEADDGKNPQEGGSHVSNDSKHSNDNLKKLVVSGIDNNNHNSGNIESESTSTTAASATGVTKAEASRAEIFRKPHDTPIRLKKDPQAYGENAALAKGMTKASGSFLRKVAASFGSVSVSSSMTHPQSLESKSTLQLQSPPRLRQDKEQNYVTGSGFEVPDYCHSTTVTAKATEINLASREFFEVDRRDRPQYAVLKRSINDAEDIDGRAALAKNVGNDVEKSLQPKTSEGEALYFL